MEQAVAPSCGSQRGATAGLPGLPSSAAQSDHFGYEDIPNWITGRVHANNIYDGSRRGSYKDTYYRYLNTGLRVPFSTGTDWFIYDFSRVYVAADRPITPTEWLDRLTAGRTYITNGPLLELTVAGQPIGGTIELQQPRAVKVHGRAIGRTDFKRIELGRACSIARWPKGSSTRCARTSRRSSGKRTLPTRHSAPACGACTTKRSRCWKRGWAAKTPPTAAVR